MIHGWRARLRGARLVTATKTEAGRHWAESRIKELTGGERIAARFYAPELLRVADAAERERGSDGLERLDADRDP
jgi:hypothetical protein